MNKKLEEILSSQQLQNFFDDLLLQNELTKPRFTITSQAMISGKRLPAELIDFLLCSKNPASQSIDQTVTNFREYCEGVLQREPTDNLAFLKFLKTRLKNEIVKGIFSKSDNSEVLQNYKIDKQGLSEFRQSILKVAGFLTPNESVIKDELFIAIEKDNLKRFKNFVANCDDSNLTEMYDRYLAEYNKFISSVPQESLTDDIKAMYEILTQVKFVNSYIHLPNLYQSNDNLLFRKIRRNVNLDFNSELFDTLRVVTNLIECYKLGFEKENIIFNGEHFVSRVDGRRVISSNQPITVQNLQTIGRNNQSGFVLPENLVYGTQNSPLSNDFSFTLSQENVSGAQYYQNVGKPLTYTTKNGFFCQKQCEFAKTFSAPNAQNEQTQYTYYYYTSLENDTGEKYVKVVEQNLENNQISVSLYAFPLNHINAGVQICRLDSNDPSFSAHNLGGKERIQTIFHIHKYNIIDQIRGEGNGEFDIMVKLDDNLTAQNALQIFDDICKTSDAPQTVYDQNNNPISSHLIGNQKEDFSAQQVLDMQQQALVFPTQNVLRTYFTKNEDGSYYPVTDTPTESTIIQPTLEQQKNILASITNIANPEQVPDSSSNTPQAPN